MDSLDRKMKKKLGHVPELHDFFDMLDRIGIKKPPRFRWTKWIPFIGGLLWYRRMKDIPAEDFPAYEVFVFYHLIWFVWAVGIGLGWFARGTLR
jgi:hypothetical protein